MATSTFDRPLEITDPEVVLKLLAIAETEAPKEPFSKYPYTDEVRKRGEELIRRCLARSEP